MNDDNNEFKGIEYKGKEQREDGEYEVFEVDMDKLGEEEEEPDFHMPSGMLLNFGGHTQLRYVTLLTVDSPELMQEHIIRILEGHAANWAATEFSGDVLLQCWNDVLEPEHMEMVGDVLRQIIEGAQNVIDTNDITSADGNRIVLRASLDKHAREGSERP